MGSLNLSQTERSLEKERAQHRAGDDHRNVAEIYRCIHQLLSSLTSIQKEQLMSAVSELDNHRKEIFKIFAGPEFYQICHSCKGGCCGGTQLLGDHIAILCMALNNFRPPKPRKYSKPIPGHRFSIHPYYHCSYLSRTGCLLGANKPFVCLSYYCSRIGPALNEEDLRKISVIRERYYTASGKVWSLLNDFGIPLLFYGVCSRFSLPEKNIRNDCESD